MTYADLEQATTVVLAGLEPEDEAGTIFLRLRKASRGPRRTRVVSIAPYASRGLQKMAGQLVPTRPGDEPAALASLVEHADYGIDTGAVILVGERLATVPGALSAAADLARRTGARLAWVPRRAGDRGAVETGCLPNLLPGGRPVADATARVDAATTWGVDSLPEAVGRDADRSSPRWSPASSAAWSSVASTPTTPPTPPPPAPRSRPRSFVVALDLRETEVTRAADVVFPVAPVTDKAGMFVTWEGRPRPFDVVLHNAASLPDLRVLSGIADELSLLGRGRPLGFRTVAEVRSEMEEMGPWDGDRAAMGLTARRTSRSRRRRRTPRDLEAAARQRPAAGRRPRAAGDRPRAVARIPAALAGEFGDAVTLTGDRGSVTLPVEVAPRRRDGRRHRLGPGQLLRPRRARRPGVARAPPSP